jgi:CheY-like chemotaxis protein
LLYELSEEGGFMRVLVVDDDEIFCRFLVEVLEEVGIVATSVTDGFAAFDLVNRVTYDVCIIDVRMPLILGTELAEAITELHPRTKFILASAFADRLLREYARRKGMLLLSKPFTRLQLLHAVKLAAGESLSRN